MFSWVRGDIRAGETLGLVKVRSDITSVVTLESW